MRDGLTFLLNGRERRIGSAPPDMTLLDYLREHEGLVGTKEGCAEGDCGACAVAVSELVDGEVRRRPLNSCICFLGMLEGKAVRTVEGLAAPDGAPHPVQAAMTAAHASQCGFCTPGIVMTLYAAHGGAANARGPTTDLLAGNLCRCTGYGPILAAADAANALPPPWIEAERQAAERAWLAAHAGGEAMRLGGDEGTFHAPTTVDA
ncbi:MAG: 2Fe-2S iron-sulfur cluster-binding protein, partial [Alphaproteobacteria bacterium]